MKPGTRLYLNDENGDRIDYPPDGTIEREFRDGKEVTEASRGAAESREQATAIQNSEEER